MTYYVIPKSGDGLTAATAFAPKYCRSLSADGITTAASMDYGREALFVIGANLTSAEIASLIANPDVLAIPPLANLVAAGAVANVQNKLEAVNLPADWVTSLLTWQQVLARVLRLVVLMQRFNGFFGRLFATGITLDSRINQIPATPRAALNQAAQSLGADTSTILGTILIRAALVIVADQLYPAGLPFGDVMLTL